VVALEEQPIVIDLPGNGADGTADPSLVRVITSLPVHGKLYDGATPSKEITAPETTITDTQSRILYVPNTNYFGADSLSYKVKKGWIESSSRLVPITVSASNDVPVAVGPSAVTTDEDTPVIFVLDGIDADGDPLQSTIRLVTGHGTLYQVDADGVTLGAAITTSPTIITNPGKLVGYIPGNDYNGADTLRYDVFDGVSVSIRITVTITVRPIEDLPVARASTHVGENSISVVGIVLDLSDVDSPLHGRITQFPAKGQLYRKTVAPQNLLTPENNEFFDLDLQYVHVEPVGGPSAQYTFTWVADEPGYTSPPITDTIIIEDSKQQPLPTGTPTNVWFHPATPVDFALNGVDPDGDSSGLLFRIVSLPQHGTLETFDLDDIPHPILSVPFIMASSDPSIGWRLRYNPADGADDSFAFTLEDQDGLFYSTPDHTIQNVVVTLSDTAPVAQAEPVLMDEDTEATFALWGIDPQGAPITSTVRLLPANGKLYQVEADGVTIGSEITSINTVVTNPNGLVHYIPKPEYSALPTADTVRYDLFNGTEFSDRITVNIGIRAVNDPPYARAAIHTGDRLSPIAIILDAGDVDSAFTGHITQFPSKGKLYRKTVSDENEITPSSPAFDDIDLWYVTDDPTQLMVHPLITRSLIISRTRPRSVRPLRTQFT
jgi:hypothetical protein